MVWSNHGVLTGCGCQVLAVLLPSWNQAWLWLGWVFRVASLPAVAAGASLKWRVVTALRSSSRGSHLLLLIASLAEVVLLSLRPVATAWRAGSSVC